MACRLDKYIWSVRLAKTRSKSADAIANGKVRLNNDSVKPSKEVRLGDEIQIIKHSAKFTFRVIQLLSKRIGAKLVQDYIVDITPEEEFEKLRLYRLSQSTYREHGAGKPTKKDRRDLEGFLENW
ncbi:S4 domain-containing protein [Crocinitomicaceae bacterium]|nr:S4 domain-containing protein [Crocinitomicaceae bacterium]